jgi:hypothetical protein
MNTSIVPIDFHLYFTQTKSCMHCHQPLRHELHAYNHFRKYHTERPVTIKEKPEYYVWFQDQWIKVNMETCMAAMLAKRPWAITKPRNIESTQRGN